MNHLLETLPYILFSLIIIALLTYSDPRRQQHRQKNSENDKPRFYFSAGSRICLAWCLVLPVAPLAISANYAGLLMYTGAVTVIGWVVVELPSSVL